MMCAGVRNTRAAFALLIDWLGNEEAGALEGLQGVEGEMRDLQLGFGCTLSCIRRGSNTIFGR